jgi:hypothetical protein
VRLDELLTLHSETARYPANFLLAECRLHLPTAVGTNRTVSSGPHASGCLEDALVDLVWFQIAAGLQELTEPEILFLLGLGQLTDLNQIDGHNVKRNKPCRVPHPCAFFAQGWDSTRGEKSLTISRAERSPLIDRKYLPLDTLYPTSNPRPMKEIPQVLIPEHFDVSPAKHLSAYLDEMTFQFNNRSNPFLFRDTLLKLIQAPVLEYRKLTAA